MSKSSEAVKRWRDNTKKRMVEALGGKCVCCEYSKSDWALEFHHLNREEKSFSFGAMRANPKSWPSIVEELRKCVLLCANCHREVEHGIREIPEGCMVFNEEYAEYKNHHVQIAQNTHYIDRLCPDCGNQFQAYLGRTIRCTACQAVKRDKANNYSARKKRRGG